LSVKHSVGIIGGNGQMGRTLKNFLCKNNVKVYVSDIGTKYSNSDIVKMSDIVVLSVPLNEYENVLSETEPVMKGRDILLMDIGSLKVKQMLIMKKYFKGEILGTHPLFGPDRNFSEGCVTVVCKTDSCSDKTQFIIDLFNANKIKTLEMSSNEHDELMSYIHSFYYFVNTAYLKLLSKKFGSIEETEEFATTSFKNFKNNLNNIFNTPSWLIEQIIFENPFIGERLNDFKQILECKNFLSEVEEFVRNNRN